MNEEWTKWVRHNLDRGCDPATLKATLQEHGFSEQDITIALTVKKISFLAKLKSRFFANLEDARNKADPSKSLLAQPNFDYQKMSSPAITRYKAAQQVIDDRIQLYTLDDFLSKTECRAVIKQVEQNLRPSTITSGKDTSKFRTSRTCDLGLFHNKIIHKIDKKISRTLGIHLNWAETMQGQKYTVGQEFKAHTDYFEPNSNEFRRFADKLGQRTWTFMVYLNDTLEGGETHFTAINQSFKPKAGRAVIWNNLHPNGEPNVNTIHHAAPVIKGNKVVITKWFRDKGGAAEYEL